MYSRYEVQTDGRELLRRFRAAREENDPEPSTELFPGRWGWVASAEDDSGCTVITVKRWGLIPPLGQGRKDRPEDLQRTLRNGTREAFIPGRVHAFPLPGARHRLL